MARRLLIVVALVAALVLALVGVSAAAARASTMRYCDRPGPAGDFIKASLRVDCRKARQVTSAMFGNSCIERTSCVAHGYRCLSYWDGSYSHPFSYSHHGLCRSVAVPSRRIVFDGG